MKVLIACEESQTVCYCPNCGSKNGYEVSE